MRRIVPLSVLIVLFVMVIAGGCGKKTGAQDTSAPQPQVKR